MDHQETLALFEDGAPVAGSLEKIAITIFFAPFFILPVLYVVAPEMNNMFSFVHKVAVIEDHFLVNSFMRNKLGLACQFMHCTATHYMDMCSTRSTYKLS